MTSNLYGDGFIPTFVSDSDSEAIARQSDRWWLCRTFVVACPDKSGRALLLLRFALVLNKRPSERAELKKGGTAGTFLCLFEIHGRYYLNYRENRTSE